MNKVRTFVAGVAVVAIGMGLMGAPAGAGAATPFKVKAAPFAGKTIRVAKKLKVLLNCNKNCSAKVTITLITPAGNDKVKGGIGLSANSTRIVFMRLSATGLAILKQNYRQSRLRVYVQAKDSETGKIARTVKTFRFRR